MALVLALDLGSTQLKCSLIDHDGRLVASASQGYETYAPCAGHLEQDPDDWRNAMRIVLSNVLARVDGRRICAIGFSGHMSGTVLLGGNGDVLSRCIMLSDSRSDGQCGTIDRVAGKRIRAITGNPVINAFTLPKLLWIKENHPDVWSRTRHVLSPKDYLRFLLTGVVSTEYTDAFNTLALDKDTRDWDDDVLASVGLDRLKFPKVLSPFDIVGQTGRRAHDEFALPEGIPVASGVADMAAAAVGTNLFAEGSSALTLGTCATFLALVPAIGDEGFGQVTYHLHALKDRFYALGSHFNGGLAVNWITRILNERGELDFHMMDDLAHEAVQVPPGSNGLLTIPFLAGSGSPYFSSSDRMVLLGASASTGRAELFRSMLEGISMNLYQTLELYDRMLSHPVAHVLLGGGGVRIEGWPQMIADVFQRPIRTVQNADASTLGAALVAGNAVGLFEDLPGAASSMVAEQDTMIPDESLAGTYGDLYRRYLEAYARLHGVV